MQPSDSPPTVWVAGTLVRVGSGSILLREAAGPEVAMQRLAEGATAFYRIAGGSWQVLPRDAAVSAGTRACVQTLMAGGRLLALRVFLGAGCGPA